MVNTYGFKDKFASAMGLPRVDSLDLVGDVYLSDRDFNSIECVNGSSSGDLAYQVVVVRDVPLLENNRLSWSFTNFLSSMVKYGISESSKDVGVLNGGDKKYNGVVLAETPKSSSGEFIGLLVSGVYKDNGSFFGDLSFVASSPVNGSLESTLKSLKPFEDYAKKNVAFNGSFVDAHKFLAKNYSN
ncbi:MAG: hypothetical protein ACLFN8_04680 [Candidatus Woesearchaeota archaeon]